MNARILTTNSEKSKGVQDLEGLAPDQVFVFMKIYPFTSFHMRQVKFPIDIGFIDQDFGILDVKTMEPETGNATAPSGTVYACEACEGYFKNNNLKVNDFWKDLHNSLTSKKV